MAPWHSTRRPLGRLSACTALTAILTACSGPAPSDDPFLTRAERTDYRETSSYADVVDFLERAAAASPSVHYTTYGFTNEGRALPLAVVGDVADPSPAAVRASGKTVVYLQGNIHAGEVCGKEALQMLLRDLLAGRHGEWRESMVLLIAPIYNADGNERVTLTNRGRQHGPIGGMGQRPNAQGYDLNRDHMKLDSPEARSVARLFTEYNPHVAVDLHTTNGTRHAYHLTYSPPLHPNTPAGIDAFLRQGLLPHVTEQVRDKYGWHYYYYGNAFAPGGGEPGWYTFDHRPRFNNNYIGLRNRIAILSEAYSYATFEERVLATLYFVEEILDHVHARADEVRRIVADADATPVAGDSLTLRAVPERSTEPVDILMGATIEETHPLTGRPLLLRADTQYVETMYEYGTFAPTLRERVPEAYLIPADLADILTRLAAHGIALEPAQATPMDAEAFHIDSVQTAERPFQGRNEQTLYGRYETTRVTPAPGDMLARVDQPLGRLLFSLVEPQSDDGFANWGFLADRLQAGGVYPIVRVPAG
ncbi:MAG: peptidase M14 [Gemmatimonadetes bacterium]|nr:peptidase M14 [Gemmatimonadota bacterium]MXX73328.1 peptidase M14 [Gemmatimonadota bacterium]MYC93163.1 peptidase M14 [Gemmatimonadota bacterium]MYG36285.1 peptidase M14 [Gemmatimonadota bacterium]MYJ17567.1 peptidase M14 [Gemmatimonadota bacterium]